MSISTRFSLERQDIRLPPGLQLYWILSERPLVFPRGNLSIISTNPYLSKARPANFPKISIGAS